MERARWTDERIDERMTAIEDESDRLFDEIAGLRSDFSALRHQMIVILAVEAVAVAGLLGVLVAAQI